VATLTGVGSIELMARKDRNLDTVCFRGSAPLAHLALLSQPDVFDQETNPDGLQRDLSPKHAAEAYEYAHRKPDPSLPRAFPELVMNVRDKKVVTIQELPETGDATVRLKFDLEKIREGKKVHVSRVDGNHRLFYAAGDDRREPLTVDVPFQIHVGLTREQERSLFVDINANQKGLNTSHLAIMRSKLTAEEMEIRDHPDRWIANRLVNDTDSPWFGLVHLGGSKKGARAQGLTRPVNFASLQTGVNRTLSKSQYIHDLTDAAAQYVIVKNYWKAVKAVFAEEWADPKSFLLLKNLGVLSMSILGGLVIDRCIPRARVGVDDMAFFVRQAKSRFDWSRTAPQGERSVTGMSGNRAALLIAGAMAAELSDERGEHLIKNLQDRLLAEAQA
jgi:DGQHR domain-containing protein